MTGSGVAVGLVPGQAQAVVQPGFAVFAVAGQSRLKTTPGYLGLSGCVSNGTDPAPTDPPKSAFRGQTERYGGT